MPAADAGQSRPDRVFTFDRPWELIEHYDWAKWSFWALLTAMLVLGAVVIVVRVRRSDHY
jgi:hypothetical protein